MSLPAVNDMSSMMFKFPVKKRDVPKRFSNYELTFSSKHYERLVTDGPKLCKYMYIGYDTITESGVALVNFTSAISPMAALSRFVGLYSSLDPILGGYKGFLRTERNIMELFKDGTCLINCFGVHASPGARTDLSEENAPVYNAVRRFALKKASEERHKALSRPGGFKLNKKK